MIGPNEIKVQALKWWKPFLQSYLSEKAFFPKSIDRLGKIQASHLTQRFEALQHEVESLYAHSKEKTGVGYSVKTADRNFRRTGSHELPDSVVFDTAEDYILFVGKKRDWELFLKNYEVISSTIPALRDWVYANCLWLTEPKIDWSSVLKVCGYFLKVPRPYLYIRQLPIDVHTKFIEDNSALIQSLLNFLIPDHIRNTGQKSFAERYFLNYDEPSIRVRVLDKTRLIEGKFLDVSIRLSDFENLELDVQNVLITENKMNFLTLPELNSAVAVWSGGGFSVSYLKKASWLQKKNILYWGDIDEHGFLILHQMRSYFTNVQSLFMDEVTFETFKEYRVNGPRGSLGNLPLLTEDEARLFDSLKKMESGNRLEQEKIFQAYVDKKLAVLFRN